MVRKSPFMIKSSASRQSEATEAVAVDNSSNLTPSRAERGPNGSGGGAVSQLPTTASAAGGSFASAGTSAILQPAFSEPVRPPRVSMLVALAPPPTVDVQAGGGATVTLPCHGAKPGLGRLLVGSLSNLFRVDSLTAGLQRSASPPPPALTPSGSSLTGIVDRTTRTSAVQLVDVRQGGSPTPSGAGVQRTSNAGTTVAGITARGGGGRSGTVTPAATDLGTTLSELTADVESRLNENQLVIQQVLGSGAFGTVYKALWKGLQVAVKTMTLTADAVTQGRHAALMEAALSKSIFHPNVVTTYTCDLKPMHVDSHRGGAMTGLQILNETEVIQEWRLYIVQEFCDGGSLRHAIEARSFLNSATGSPQMEWVLQMAREIAVGLQYLHEHNIIHGDLNPANVLLRRDDSSVLGYTAKIADFGLSVHMQAEQSHVSNTKRGTPFYTAPEVTHAGNLTRFADVFSYGVVLWELYCSRSCWMYGPQGRLIHQRGFPHLPPSCPRAYATLVSNCMQPAHKQRPSFKQIGVQLSSMLRELEYTAGYATAAVAPPSWYQSQGPSPQHPPQQHYLQDLLSAQPYSMQPPQYQRYLKERAISPLLPSPQLNPPLQPPPLLQRPQPVGQPMQSFQKISGRSSMGSSSGGAQPSTSNSTSSSPRPPSQQLLQLQQGGFRNGSTVNVAAAAPIWQGGGRRASWEPGTEADVAAADRTQGPGGADFFSAGVVASGGTSRPSSGRNDLSAKPAPATTVVSVAEPSSLPYALRRRSAPSPVLLTEIAPEVPSPTALLVGPDSSGSGTPAPPVGATATAALAAELPPAAITAGVIVQSRQSTIAALPAASVSVSMAPVTTVQLSPIDIESMTVEAAACGFDGAVKQEPGLPGGGTAQPADLDVATVTVLPPPPSHNVRMVTSAGGALSLTAAAALAALSLPSADTASAADLAVVADAVAGGAAVDSGGSGSVPVPSSALAGVMRAFEIPAEAPRFAPPDLPTVLEAEDEPTSASHSQSAALLSYTPPKPGDSVSVPDGVPMPDDFILNEGGPSIGDKISASVEDGGGGNTAARVFVPGARVHSAPPHRRSYEGCSGVPVSIAVAALAAAEMGAAAVRPVRSRTAPGVVTLTAAGADTGQGDVASELESEDFALPTLAAATCIIESPQKLTVMGTTSESANMEDLGGRSVALPRDIVPDFAPPTEVPEGHADTAAFRPGVTVAAIATLDNATSIATAAAAAAGATVGSDDGSASWVTTGRPVSLSHLPLTPEAADVVRPEPWRDAGFPPEAKDGAAAAERLTAEESVKVVMGSTNNGSSSQPVAAVQSYGRASLGAPGRDATTSSGAGPGPSFSRGSTGSLWQRRQPHKGPISYLRRQQIQPQQRPGFSRLSVASGTCGGDTSEGGHSAFCRPSLNAGGESPNSSLLPGRTAGIGLPNGSGISPFTRPGIGDMALVPAPAGTAGAGVTSTSASTGPRFSRPSLGALPPSTRLEVTTAAATGAVLPPGTSPFARPTLTASESTFQADAISHAPSTAGGAYWAPTAATSPFARPSLGTRPLAPSKNSDMQPVPGVPLTPATTCASSPFARPSLNAQLQPPQVAPPSLSSLPLATVMTPPAGETFFARPSLGVDAHWAPVVPLPPGPLPPAASLPSRSPGASPFTRPSLGSLPPAGGAWASLPLGSAAHALPGTSPFARPSLNSLPRSGALLQAVPQPAAVTVAHFTDRAFMTHSLGTPAPGRASNAAIQMQPEDWRTGDGAGAVSAIAYMAVPQSSPFGRPSLNVPGEMARPNMHGTGALPTLPPAGPFSRPTYGLHLAAPSPSLLGPMQGVMPMLLGPSLPALPVGGQVFPSAASFQQKPHQPTSHECKGVPKRNDSFQTAQLYGNSAGAFGAAHADSGDGGGGGGGNVASASGRGVQPRPEIIPAVSESDEDAADRVTFGSAAETSVDLSRRVLGSPVRGETMAPPSTLGHPPQQLQPPQQEELRPQAHGRLLTGLQVQLPSSRSSLPAGAGLQQPQPQIIGAAFHDLSIGTTWPPPLPSPPLPLRHQHNQQSWSPGTTVAASPGGGFGGVFGSPVLASFGSEASASVASFSGGSMLITPSKALPPAAAPAPATSLAAAAASISSRQAQQDAMVPVLLSSYSHARGASSGDHLSRSLDSVAFFGVAESARSTAYPYGHGHRFGPHSNKGSMWHDAADGGLWIGGGSAAACRRRTSTVGPYSHGQMGSSRSYIPMYPSSMPRSAVNLGSPGPCLSPQPQPMGVSSTSTRPPPRFQRDSLRTLEAAAATTAGGSSFGGGSTGILGAQAGVNRWDGDRQQQQQQLQQRQRQQPRQRKAQARGGLLRTLRSAVMPGSQSLLLKPAAVAAAATSDSDKERESSGTESGIGVGGNHRQREQQPPSFSRIGVSFGNGADDADGDADDVYGDVEDISHRSCEGDGGSRHGHVVTDLLAAGSLTAALAMPRPSRAGAANPTPMAEVGIPSQDLLCISSSAPPALAPGMLVGSCFTRLGGAGGGRGGADGSPYTLDVSEHDFGAATAGGVASSNSFDEALRLAKSSLSTVPESGPSLSQASIARSSQGSERLLLAASGAAAGGDQTAATPSFGRFSHRSIGREDVGSGGASGSATQPCNIVRRTHASSASRPQSPQAGPPSLPAEEPAQRAGARTGSRLWPLPEAAPLSSSAPTAVAASVMQRMGVRGAR
ncbi:hypothetical protein Vretifemale_14684 [Volvox reticuliferus]|uniref:Protein kinase domain-containing protein n=2 Tax=Volvox reticuliferus TaxID=1737510 RepID=A0A8J4FUA1_9CHLO|nr:hypothetical protein Vretifemale_14684 [Volvox reticuliferus]